MTPVLVSQQRGVMQLRLNRPQALNALTNEALDALHAALSAGAADSSVRCVLLSAEGDKAFCVGIDLVERTSLTTEQKGAQSQRVLHVVQALRRFPKPVVAAIGGWCLGAGLELCLACDIRVAAEDARFGFPEMELGAYPGGGGAVLLPRIVGLARAVEWLLSARKISADEASAIGLVTRVVARADLEPAAGLVADRSTKLAPLAVAALKRSIEASLCLPLEEAFAADQQLRRPLDATRDYEEGLRAFKEKRAPIFVGA